MVIKLFPLMLIIISFLLIGNTLVYGQTPYIVGTDVLNVRACPGTQCDVIGTVTKGQVLNVLDTEGNWFKISFENGVGFVSQRFVKTETELKNRSLGHQNSEKPAAQGFSGVLSKVLNVKSLVTWVVIFSLAVMLYFLFYYFSGLDQKLIEFLGSSKEGGNGWPLLASAASGILLAAAVLINSKEVQWFVSHGISVTPTCRNIIHWMIFGAILIEIMTVLGVLVESIIRVGPLGAAFRFILLAIISATTLVVAFFMTILLTFIILIIIALTVAAYLLWHMAFEERVYYYR